MIKIALVLGFLVLMMVNMHLTTWAASIGKFAWFLAMLWCFASGFVYGMVGMGIWREVS
jgi:hypothetical protein